jgi:endonuclease YncB( thermonuclease family)
MLKNYRSLVRRLKNIIYSNGNTSALIIIACIIVLYTIECIEYGNVEVIDGDRLVINNHKVRLYGIDAVERNQLCKNRKGNQWKCGIDAKNHLTKLINANKVVCLLIDKDRYKRSLSICYSSQHQNLNAEMVKAGYAVAYTRYSSMFVPYEKEARQKQNGIWSGKFKMPEVYRMNNKANTN